MKRMLDMDDFPLGTRVMTPSGRIGVVVKHHKTSKIDHFQRISVSFGANPRDGVVLQPQLLMILEGPNENPAGIGAAAKMNEEE